MSSIRAADAPNLVLILIDEEIGEAKDVAADNPDIVKKLQGHVETMWGDLGVDKAGPGRRPSGKVADPKPLLFKSE